MDRVADRTHRPGFTFSVYQQVATRRYIDEQTIWTVMRFEHEPAERARSRQITRFADGDPRGRAEVPEGEFDERLEDLNRLDQGASRRRIAP